MPGMMKAFKFRMYPNKAQTAILEDTLETCRHLWNTALADRKNTYKETGKSRTYNQQAAMRDRRQDQNLHHHQRSYRMLVLLSGS
jgi:transposase